jgi:hypothetical protein
MASIFYRFSAVTYCVVGLLVILNFLFTVLLNIYFCYYANQSKIKRAHQLYNCNAVLVALILPFLFTIVLLMYYWHLVLTLRYENVFRVKSSLGYSAEN